MTDTAKPTASAIATPSPPVPDASELRRVIADFLAMGHVDNVRAMFKQEPRYHSWTGLLLEDERLSVRLGLAVLYEYLLEERPEELHRAIPSLALQLKSDQALLRGEAVNLLGIIGTREALELVATMTQDPSPQVVEVAADILECGEDA
ncbi:hypothetical protein [Desulfogranum mediterraneum]|uniref:hypothetical protein n=1 Tax=Desulfogranum mediterraneum TaxID=160661 RepID=UPI0004104E34|nr:hypothetical protein [Desulfogranum mediterraneum]